MPRISYACPRDRSFQTHPYSWPSNRSCGQASNPPLRDHHTPNHPVTHPLYTSDTTPGETSNEWTPEPTPFTCGLQEDAAPPAGPYWYGSLSRSSIAIANNTGFADLFASFVPPSPYPTATYMANFPSPAMHDIPDEYWETMTPHYPSCTADTSLVGSVNRMRCQWDTCEVILDDISHGGLRRHFRDHHHAPRGERMRCKWGSCCRSEEMLFENIPKHIAECHLKSMAQRCPWCYGTFARKDSLKRHQNAGCPAVGQQPQ
ncbi:hypothetical protein C8T65DRAFT_647823 [Cerioporus squamosus]|nr:hypothetical protein C8T65DRAFT_647823 [Cerioporus squamosus]